MKVMASINIILDSLPDKQPTSSFVQNICFPFPRESFFKKWGNRSDFSRRNLFLPSLHFMVHGTFGRDLEISKFKEYEVQVHENQTSFK